MTQVTDTSPASSSGRIYLQELGLNLAMAVPADALAPNGAMPSTATAMTTNTWFCKSSMAINVFR